MLYKLIGDACEITGRELNQRYEEVAEHMCAGESQTPIGCRDWRNKLDKLREYDVIERERLDHRWLYAVTNRTLDPSIEFNAHYAHPE